MTVVPFPKPEEVRTTWVCACGCQTFRLSGEGDLSCADCYGPVTDAKRGAWIAQEDGDAITDEPARTNRDVGSADIALRRLSKKVLDPDTKMAVVVKDNGDVAIWHSVETSEQVEWAHDLLDTAKGMIFPAPDADA